MIKIDKVGVEFEYGTAEGSLDEYVENNNIGYNKFHEFQEGILKGYKCKYSREYYNNVCELNVGWTNKENLIDITKQIKKKVIREESSIEGREPKYVGTHMHLLLDRGKERITHKMVNRQIFLVSRLYEYITDLIFKIDLKKLSPKSTTNLIRTIRRLTSNHNLLINFDKKIMEGRMQTQLNNHGMGFYYVNGINNKKYQPIIWSRAYGGKPFSLELRLLSNSLLFMENNEDFLLNIANKTEELLNVKLKNINQIAEKGNILYQHNKLLHWLDNANSLSLGELFINRLKDIPKIALSDDYMGQDIKYEFMLEFKGINILRQLSEKEERFLSCNYEYNVKIIKDCNLMSLKHLLYDYDSHVFKINKILKKDLYEEDRVRAENTKEKIMNTKNIIKHCLQLK